jgi:beta-lactamase class A
LSAFAFGFSPETSFSRGFGAAEPELPQRRLFKFSDFLATKIISEWTLFFTLHRKMMDIAAARRGDENVATPQEMVRLLDAIYKEKALNKQATAELIKRLSTKKDSYIPRYLPEGIQVANKPGELEGVRTDSGIVFVPNRPFAMSVMTAYNRDERAAERAISEVAFEACRYFEMRAKASKYGRVLPSP